MGRPRSRRRSIRLVGPWCHHCRRYKPDFSGRLPVHVLAGPPDRSRYRDRLYSRLVLSSVDPHGICRGRT